VVLRRIISLAVASVPSLRRLRVDHGQYGSIKHCAQDASRLGTDSKALPRTIELRKYKDCARLFKMAQPTATSQSPSGSLTVCDQCDKACKPRNDTHPDQPPSSPRKTIVMQNVMLSAMPPNNSDYRLPRKALNDREGGLVIFRHTTVA
jgi:hypothetical protein